MKREDVNAMAAALQQVAEKKLDPVDKKDVKGKFYDRADKDIDNDGDADSTDKYLHTRRKAVTKAVKGGKGRSEVETQVQEDAEELDELSKKTLGSYVKKAKDSYAGAGGDLTRGSETPQQQRAKKKAISTYVKRNRGIDRAVDKLTKESTRKSPIDRYKDKVASLGKTEVGDGQADPVSEDAYATTGPEAIKKVSGPAQSIQPSKEIKQGKESSSTADTGKLTKVTKPDIVDGEDAIADDKRAEKASATKASAAGTDDVNKKPTVKEETLSEDYHAVQMKYLNKLTSVANDIASVAQTLYDNHMKAMDAGKKMSALYAKGKEPSDELRKQSYTGKMYDCKYTVRALEDALDNLNEKLPGQQKEDVALASPNPVRESRFGRVVTLEDRTPVSMRDALAMMSEGSREDHYKGATKPQAYDDNWAPAAKAFANKHPVDQVDAADINKVVQKNKQEVGLSLQRSVNYRHNDQKIGDKKPVGNDGK